MTAIMIAIVDGDNPLFGQPRILERRTFPVATLHEGEEMLEALAQVAPATYDKMFRKENRHRRQMLRAECSCGCGATSARLDLCECGKPLGHN